MASNEQNMPEIQPMFNPKDPSELELHRGNLLLAVRHLRGIAGGDVTTNVYGHGFERDDAQLYVPGDDIRDIDWNITARDTEGQVHIRRRLRDNKPNVWVVSDALKGLNTVNGGEFHESDLGLSAVHRAITLARYGNFRFGVALTSDNDSLILRPAQGRNQVSAIYEGMAELVEKATVTPPEPPKKGLFRRAKVSTFAIAEKETLETGSLGRLLTHIGGHCMNDVVIVVSNFRDVTDPAEPTDGWAGPLDRMATRRNHLMAVQLTNPWYDHLPEAVHTVGYGTSDGAYMGGSDKRGAELRQVATEFHTEQGQRINKELEIVQKHIVLSTTDRTWQTTLDTELKTNAQFKHNQNNSV